jgi:hypothetical protein
VTVSDLVVRAKCARAAVSAFEAIGVEVDRYTIAEIASAFYYIATGKAGRLDGEVLSALAADALTSYCDTLSK